jgi:hypothetical protein
VVTWEDRESADRKGSTQREWAAGRCELAITYKIGGEGRGRREERKVRKDRRKREEGKIER